MPAKTPTLKERVTDALDNAEAAHEGYVGWHARTIAISLIDHCADVEDEDVSLVEDEIEAYLNAKIAAQFAAGRA